MGSIAADWAAAQDLQSSVKGVLQPAPGGFRLALEHGGLPVYNPHARTGARPELTTTDWPAIYGTTDTGREFSLLRCRLLETRGTLNAPAPEHEVIDVGIVFDGSHLRLDHAIVDTMTVSIEQLTPWLHSATIANEAEPEKPWPQGHSVLPDGTTIDLRYYRTTEAVRSSSDVGVRQITRTDLLVTWTQPVTPDVMLDVAGAIADFVSISALAPCEPIHIAFETMGRDKASVILPYRDEPIVLADRDFFLPGARFESLLQKWLEVHQMPGHNWLRNAASAGVEVLSNQALSAGLRLNRAVSAAEGMSAYLEEAGRIGPPIPTTEHDRIAAAAVKDLDSADAAYLKKKLLPNTRSLTQKLELVAAQIPQDAATYLLPAGGKWARAASGGRSKYAHGTTDLDSSPTSALAQFVALLVLVAVSKALGFSFSRPTARGYRPDAAVARCGSSTFTRMEVAHDLTGVDSQIAIQDARKRSAC